MQQDPTNEDLLQKEHEARKRYSDILSSSLSLIQQQSEIEWIKYGDEKTRLFHTKARQRKIATYTYSIQDENGKSMEGFNRVKQVMHDFYKNLLGRHHCTRKGINMQVIQLGPTLNCEDQIGLCNKFSSNDIKDAFFSIPSSKSLGPDGFNSGFFNAAWGTIGPLVCSAI